MTFQEECYTDLSDVGQSFDFPRYNTFRHLLFRLVSGGRRDRHGALGRILNEYAPGLGQSSASLLRSLMVELIKTARISRQDERILANSLIHGLDARFPSLDEERGRYQADWLPSMATAIGSSAIPPPARGLGYIGDGRSRKKPSAVATNVTPEISPAHIQFDHIHRIIRENDLVPEIVKMVIAIHLPHHLDGHSDQPCRLPGIDAILQHPGHCSVTAARAASPRPAGLCRGVSERMLDPSNRPAGLFDSVGISLIGTGNRACAAQLACLTEFDHLRAGWQSPAKIGPRACNLPLVRSRNSN